MSAKPRRAIPRLRSQFEDSGFVAGLHGVVREPTRISIAPGAERRERPAMQRRQLRSAQRLADGALGELVSETQEVTFKQQHPALDAFLDRIGIIVRDLVQNRRLASLAEHGRGAERLLSYRGQPAHTSGD